MVTLRGLAGELAAGATSVAELVESCLERIAASSEGAATFLQVDAEGARRAAHQVDQARRRGQAGVWAGIPISVKDLFDVQGQVTTAGSRLLLTAPPAAADAPVIARLRDAGFILIGRTNMTEFAYSGVGLNPHYGTPRNPWDRATVRIPGGSSSGAAVSVAEGMAHAGLGTDTGGSCRIPAALCGLVGFKPTARRVPRAGVYPLSPTLDSVGPIARSVECCALVDAVLAGIPAEPLPSTPLAGLRLGLPRSWLLEDMDAAVGAAFERALELLAGAGAQVVEVPLAALDELPGINAKGGFSAAEAWEHHRRLIAAHADGYDPRVLARILRGREQDAADYIELGRRRADFIARLAPVLSSCDAWLMPTVPIVAPAIAELAADDAYARINMLLLRNPSVVNFIDGCAVSIPMHAPAAPPVGLTLFHTALADRRLLALAAAVEAALNRHMDG